MQIKELRPILTKLRQIEEKPNTTYGSIIRHYRKLNGITLTTLAEDICSISYLCKLEKGSLIPNPKILEQLRIRLGLPKNIFDEPETNPNIKEIIKMDYVPIDIYEEVKNKFDHTSKLIKASYEILNNGNFELGYNLTMEVTNYITNFLPEELLLLFYLFIRLKYENEEHFHAIDDFEEISIFEEHKEILINAKVYYFKSLFRLNKNITMSYLYDNILTDLLHYNKMEEYYSLRQYKLAQDAKYVDTNELQKEIDFTIGKENIELDYIWFVHHFYYTKDYETALTYIKEIAYDTSYYHLMYFICLDKLQKKDEIIDVFENHPYQHFKKTYKIISKYIYHKYASESIPQDIEYFMSNILVLTKDYQILDYMYDELINKYKQNHYYKDAVKMLEEKLQYLNDIHHIILE